MKTKKKLIVLCKCLIKANSSMHSLLTSIKHLDDIESLKMAYSNSNDIFSEIYHLAACECNVDLSGKKDDGCIEIDYARRIIKIEASISKLDDFKNTLPELVNQ